MPFEESVLAPFDPAQREVLEIAHRLVESITFGNADTYRSLCVPDLSCFEEVTPHRIDGVDFHVSLIQQMAAAGRPARRFDLLSPRVQLHGDCAIVTYTRLTTPEDVPPRWSAFNETRVFFRVEGAWKMAHFHRSPA